MRKKTAIVLGILVLVALAAILAVWYSRRGGGAQVAEEEAYDRIKSPEYQKIMEFEKAEQTKTMGEIARARQNLAEAQDAKLEPEVIKELEGEVEKAEAELELERERMRANLRRELWKEQHPQQAKIINESRAREASIMAELDAARKRLAAAEEGGASEDEKTALKAGVDALVAKLAQNHTEAEAALRKLNNK